MKTSYQTLKQQLDDILTQLQADELDVDEAMKLYQQGQKVVAELEKYLAKTKAQLPKAK